MASVLEVILTEVDLNGSPLPGNSGLNFLQEKLVIKLCRMNLLQLMKVYSATKTASKLEKSRLSLKFSMISALFQYLIGLC